MPYGPAYDPSVPYDGVERGLLGYFVNSYIENQYEFVLKEWAEAGEFAGRVRLSPSPRTSSSGPMTRATASSRSLRTKGPR